MSDQAKTLLADLLAIVNRHQGLNAEQAMADIHAACQAAIDHPVATRQETTPPPQPEPPPDAPRSTVPRPAHARLVETLREIYGLDDSSSDDAIVLAALEHAPR